MKRYSLIFGIIVCVLSFLLLVSVTGCDTGTGVGDIEENKLTIDGNTYLLSNLYHEVIDVEELDFLFILRSEDVDIDERWNPAGSGAYIAIELWHDNGASGRYLHSEKAGVGNGFELLVMILYPDGNHERHEDNVIDGVIDLEVIGENAYTIDGSISFDVDDSVVDASFFYSGTSIEMESRSPNPPRS